MKLLIVSHPCVTPVNQQLFVEVQRLTGWTLSLVGPSNWIDDYGALRGLERGSGFQGDILPLPVWMSGNIPLHTYRSFFLPLLRQLRPDAIYVHNEPYAASTAQVLMAAQLSGLPSAFGFYSAQNLHKTYPPPFRWTEQWVYRRSSFAFPCSQTVLDTLREKGYRNDATLLPLGIDPALYRPTRTDPALRTTLLQGADLLLGYLGRITKEKGLETLLKSLAQLPSSLAWRLALVGTGSDSDELRTLSHTLGIADKIEWVGYVDHTAAPQYLSAFDVLVLPSETQPNWKEQFGRVVVEALACGTPVLGTDSGEIPHLIGRTGGGLVVEERNPDALREGVLALAQSPDYRNALADTGRAYVHDHFQHSSLASSFATTVDRAMQAQFAS